MPSTLSTYTVQNLLDYARAHTSLKLILGIGGVANEPGMSIVNDVLQTVLARPFAWKFNRKFAPFFVTQAFVQDYFFAGACAFTLAPVVASGGQSSLGGGGVGIDLASNAAITQIGTTVTVNCLQRHNLLVGQTIFLNNVFTAAGVLVPALNAVFTMDTNAMTSTWTNGFVVTGLPTPTSFTFTATGGQPTCGAAGISDFGWLESATITDINNTGVPQPTGPIEAQDRISPCYTCDETEQLCLLQDLGNGILQFRINPCAPAYSMAIYATYQARARFLTRLQDNWAPWPDSLAYVLRAGIKAFAYDLADKPLTEKQMKMQQFDAAVKSALTYSDSENSNMGFAPSSGLMR
ncbi:MAG TPA: hypothetical protein VHA06_18530 [Candidatus Angelobacter sp.]|jgi:hypothetical protein|nr:hypothetical protein [Candidatus Angelobacter sp.]